MSKLDKFKRKDKNSDNVWSSISDLMSGLMIVFLFISVIFMSKVIDENTNINLDILGYLDPNITVNKIVNGEIVGKFHPELPERLVNIIKCKNPRCITSIEQELPHICELTDRENVVYRCKYCEEKVNR